MASKFSEIFGDYFYLIFRILIGLMFLCHGGGKLFGWFGSHQPPFLTQLWFGGMIEFFIGGIFLVFGFFTRISAGISAIEMMVAFFQVHVPMGFSQLPQGEHSFFQQLLALIPYFNKGELALLYLSAFLVLITFGARRWAFDRLLEKNELLKKII